MKALLCESFAGIDLDRRRPATPVPVGPLSAEEAVAELVEHCSVGFLLHLRDELVPGELRVRLPLDPPPPLPLAAVDTDEQEGE